MKLCREHLDPNRDVYGSMQKLDSEELRNLTDHQIVLGKDQAVNERTILTRILEEQDVTIETCLDRLRIEWNVGLL